jgi:hypothetical protein
MTRERRGRDCSSATCAGSLIAPAVSPGNRGQADPERRAARGPSTGRARQQTSPSGRECSGWAANCPWNKFSCPPASPTHPRRGQSPRDAVVGVDQVNGFASWPRRHVILHDRGHHCLIKHAGLSACGPMLSRVDSRTVGVDGQGYLAEVVTVVPGGAAWDCQCTVCLERWTRTTWRRRRWRRSDCATS